MTMRNMTDTAQARIVMALVALAAIGPPEPARAAASSIDPREVEFLAWYTEYGHWLRTMFAASANELSGHDSSPAQPQPASMENALRDAQQYDPSLRVCMECAFFASQGRLSPETTARDLACATYALQGFSCEEESKLQLPAPGGPTLRRIEARACSACRAPVPIDMPALIEAPDTEAYFRKLGGPANWPHPGAPKPPAETDLTSLRSACRALRESSAASSRPPSACEEWETCMVDYVTAHREDAGVPATDPRFATARDVATVARQAMKANAPEAGGAKPAEMNTAAGVAPVPREGGPVLTDVARLACAVEWSR